MDLRARAAPLDAFALDPAVVHLNHGSFGACPRAALAAQAAWRDRLEAATMRFFVREWPRAADEARVRVAAFVGADPEGLAFVPNATTAVATALDALVEPGAEIVTTDHAYAACHNAAARVAAARGGRLAIARVPVPVADPAAPVAAILAAVTPATRVVLVDHVTSPTALVLDVAALARALAPRGVHVVVDGAHAPGMLDLDLDGLARAGVAVYAGNLHKWAYAPKGAAILWVRDDLQDRVHPLVTSHGWTVPPPDRFRASHDWTGTHDPTPYLAAPAALDEIARLAGGWPAARARQRALALAMRDRLAAALGAIPLAGDAATGAMAALRIALPAGATAAAVEAALLDAGVEAPVVAWPRDGAPGAALVRVSAPLYACLDDADRLAAALRALGVGPAPPPPGP